MCNLHYLHHPIKIDSQKFSLFQKIAPDHEKFGGKWVHFWFRVEALCKELEKNENNFERNFVTIETMRLVYF